MQFPLHAPTQSHTIERPVATPEQQAVRAQHRRLRAYNSTARTGIEHIVECVHHLREGDDADQIVRLCTRGLALVIQPADATREMALRLRAGSAHCFIGIYGEAYVHALRALELARVTGTLRDEAEANALLSLALTGLGRHDQAHGHQHRALDCVKALRDARVTGSMAESVGTALLLEGRLAEAREIVEHGIRVTEFMQSYSGRIGLVHTAAQIAVEQARWRYAEQWLVSASALQVTPPSPRWAAQSRLTRARIAAGRNQMAEAIREITGVSDEFLSLKAPSRAVGAAMLAVTFVSEHHDAALRKRTSEAAHRAHAALRAQQNAQSVQSASQTLKQAHALAEVERLRAELLTMSLKQLETDLAMRKPQYARQCEKGFVTSAQVLHAIEEHLKQATNSLTLIRMETPWSMPPDVLEGARLQTESFLGCAARLMVRSPNLAYFLIKRTGLRIVHASLAELSRWIDAQQGPAPVASDAEENAVGVETPAGHRIVAAVQLPASRATALDVLRRVDRVAGQMPAGLAGAVAVSRMR